MTGEDGRKVGVYHLGFWDESKRSQHVQSYRNHGLDEQTAHQKTRSDEMQELRRDPDYRRAVSEDRLAAQEAEREHGRVDKQMAEIKKEVGSKAAPSMSERTQQLIRNVAAKLRSRERDSGRGL